jgi:hypothetical protein
MKRKLCILILLVCAAAGTARAEETDMSPQVDWSAFKALSRKNIFDPNRSGPASYHVRPRPKVILTFTFRGTVDSDAAFFTGEGVGKGFVKPGETLNGFKLMKIPTSYEDPSVILTDPAGEIVILKEGESMRRVDEGPWTKTDEAPVEAVQTPSATPVQLQPGLVPFPQVGPKTYNSAGVELHGAARETEILKQLRLKREQEDK